MSIDNISLTYILGRGEEAAKKLGKFFTFEPASPEGRRYILKLGFAAGATLLVSKAEKALGLSGEVLHYYPTFEARKRDVPAVLVIKDLHGNTSGVYVICDEGVQIKAKPPNMNSVTELNYRRGKDGRLVSGRGIQERPHGKVLLKDTFIDSVGNIPLVEDRIYLGQTDYEDLLKEKRSFFFVDVLDPLIKNQAIGVFHRPAEGKLGISAQLRITGNRQVCYVKFSTSPSLRNPSGTHIEFPIEIKPNATFDGTVNALVNTLLDNKKFDKKYIYEKEKLAKLIAAELDGVLEKFEMEFSKYRTGGVFGVMDSLVIKFNRI